MTPDIADPARDAEPSRGRTLESRCVDLVSADIVLPDAACLDLVVGMCDDAIAVAFAGWKAALQGEAGVVRVALAAVAHAVVGHGRERTVSPGDRQRRAHGDVAVRTEGLRG